MYSTAYPTTIFTSAILPILSEEWRNTPKAEVRARPADDLLFAYYANTISVSQMQNDEKGILKPMLASVS